MKYALITIGLALLTGSVAVQDNPCNVFGRTLCPWCECHQIKVIWVQKRTSDTGEGVLVAR